MSYNEAYDLVMGHEGNYSYDPDDLGGETFKGISRVFWSSWPGWKIIDQHKNANPHSFREKIRDDPNLKSLVVDFYKVNFWQAMRLDTVNENSPALATDLFDMAVNLGIGRAGEYFQRTLNALNNRGRLYRDITVDGRVGPKTMQAFKSAVGNRGIPLIYKLVNIFQGYHYIRQMEANEVNEKWIGWFKRVDFIA